MCYATAYEQIEEALEAQDRAALLRQTLDQQGLITGRTIGAVGGKSAWTTSGFGREVMEFYENLRPSGLFGGILDNPASATQKVVKWTRANATTFGHQFEYLRDAVKDLKRLRAFSTDAERQLALSIPDARAIGVSYRVCENCPRFFRVFAKIEKRTLVFADPDWVYVFLRDGSSIKVSRFDRLGRPRSAQEILERFADLEKSYP